MPDSTDTTTIPANVPVCPVRGSVIYPTMVQHIDASRALSIAAIDAAMLEEKVILIVSQRDKDVDAMCCASARMPTARCRCW